MSPTSPSVRLGGRAVSAAQIQLLARGYFALQAVCGALWWILVAAVPSVAAATLEGLPRILIACLDIPLFVLASAAVAAGFLQARWAVVPWTVLVALVTALYATVTGLAGWGAMIMVLAAIGTACAGAILHRPTLLTDVLLQGPLAFAPAAEASARSHWLRTLQQLLVFWGLFLGVLPALILGAELRWGLHLDAPAAVRALGLVLLLAASALGVWSARVMATHGEGTPLPSEQTRAMVTSGPYAAVRNPMAVAGIAQGAAVGLLASSWLVVLYAVAGSVLWNLLVRPLEEDDLEERFGEEFRAYREQVGLWWPRLGAGERRAAEE